MAAGRLEGYCGRAVGICGWDREVEGEDAAWDCCLAGEWNGNGSSIWYTFVGSTIGPSQDGGQVE